MVFGIDSGRQFKERLEAWTGFRGMRAGVRYADPLWPSYGSTDVTEPRQRGEALGGGTRFAGVDLTVGTSPPVPVAGGREAAGRACL